MYLVSFNQVLHVFATTEFGIVAKRDFRKLGEIFLYANKIVSPGINCKL